MSLAAQSAIARPIIIEGRKPVPRQHSSPPPPTDVTPETARVAPVWLAGLNFLASQRCLPRILLRAVSASLTSPTACLGRNSTLASQHPPPFGVPPAEQTSPTARAILYPPVMPTPSSPGPQPPYTISATCPDPDEQQTAQHPSTGWHTRSDAYNSTHDVSRRAARHSSPEQDVDTSPSSTRSPLGSQSLSSDGPSIDMAATSPSTADTQGRTDQHPMAETDDERTDSPCDVTSSESLQISRPRHGVGTGTDIDMHAHTDLNHGTEEEYALPSMGYGFPSKRVSPASLSTMWQETN